MHNQKYNQICVAVFNYSQAVESTLFLMKPTSATYQVFSNNIIKKMWFVRASNGYGFWIVLQGDNYYLDRLSARVSLVPRSVLINRQMETLCWHCCCHVTDPKQTPS
jgi:hypothetical protein